ncbi:hypothetical protein H6P81_021611 [Aristolochia fimbriata]|uniref:Large ribosomal subunit protein uL22c n=1 Tax=Aristolochia fimbriata TaxID=158543 RepID=A0AAV7DQF1_ARIFI|nr:hypothetical protein H6P81_021611 [Aristolochia fimbriata]
MPLGTAIHNIEITLGKGGKLARAAGAVAKLIAKEGKSATLRLPSGEVRLISKNCSATVGQVGNVGVNQKSLGKAGSKCWLGKRPVVRGVVMNPVDHPHGGGEGRAPIGKWRTSNQTSNKRSNKIKSRQVQALAQHIRMSAHKTRRVIDQIRGRSYEETLMLLELMPYRASYPIFKLLYSAAANASHNRGFNEGDLYISKAEVNEGAIMKRLKPRREDVVIQ